VVAHIAKIFSAFLARTSLQLDVPPYISLVQGDTGMIEQVLMNLAVNARDAMPGA
jgi:signal transduction histidine kinase